MSAIDMSATMDALAAAVPPGATSKVYPYPADSVTVPCAVVGYPTTLDFDVTFKRGSDRAIFPVWFLVGKVDERSARDKLSAIIAGASGIKDAIDGDLGGAVQTARVTGVAVDTVTVGTVAYLACRFDTEVYS